MLEDALTFARDNREQFLAALFEFLRFQSISTLPEHASNVIQTADWLVEQLTQMGFTANVVETEGHPLVYAENLTAGPDAYTVLLYGHYDVQPVDPLEDWVSPPFEPEVRDEVIYARGAIDDKGQVAIQLSALQAILAVGELPVNIKILLEGEEESGSRAIMQYVADHTSQLAADSVLVSDTGFVLLGQPTIPYSLRGIISTEIRVSGPKMDLHSGRYGGTLRNPIHALADIISALYDDGGQVTVPGFYDAVRPLGADERELLGRLPYALEDWQRETGVEVPWGEDDFSLMERIGARPSLDVNGIMGGYQGEGGKTIIPAEASAKITMRLVTDQDPEVIATQFTDHVHSLAPSDLNVDVEIQELARPAFTPIDSPEVKEAARAYQAAWGKETVFMRGGGSIPVIAELQTALNAPVVMMGYGLPDAGVHAPNEHLLLDQFHRGTEAAIHYYYYLAELAEARHTDASVE